MRRAVVPFDRQCALTGLPVPVAEHRFHPVRRWRFDWAWPAERLAIEVEGGVFLPGGGRHTRGAGFTADCEKYAEAAILGWRVIRVLPRWIDDGRARVYAARALRGGG